MNEFGYVVNMQPIYINTYNNNELFGHIDSKTGFLICFKILNILLKYLNYSCVE
jgi:hypothetical protein